MFNWPVVPVCSRQRRDVREEDLLEGGLYRKCDSHRAGGGYDPLPRLAGKRLGKMVGQLQFVVQLRGCPLRCPYCYVTPQGIWGNAEYRSSAEIISAYKAGHYRIFHLMGGAPALYLEHWPELIQEICGDEVFHSDLLLIERPYKESWLKDIFTANTLYAINIKGTSDEELCMNTQVIWSRPLVELFWDNLDKIIYSGRASQCYLTFTNCQPDGVLDFLCKLNQRYPRGLVESLLEDYVFIPLKQYNALKEWWE